MAHAIPNENNIVATVVVVTIAVLWYFVLLTAMFVTLYRVERMVRTRKPLVIFFLSSCFTVVAIVYGIIQGTFWPELTRFFDDLFQLMGYMLMVMVAVIITLVISTIPHHPQEKLRRVFQIFGAFINAKKSRVCPPVNPPEDFQVKS